MVQASGSIRPLDPPDEAALPAAERLLYQFFGHTPAAVAMFDTQMRYVLYSRRWLQDYGLGERDLTGLSHYEVFPEIGERWKALHRRALAGEVLSCDEDPFPRMDGRTDWVRWEIGPWYQPDGSIGGMVMFTEVITQQVEAREALRRQAAELARANAELRRTQNRFRRLFDADIAGIMLGSLTGEITEANDAFLSMVGYSREDLASGRLRWDAITPAEYASGDASMRADLRREGRAGPREKEYIRKDGSRVPVLVGATLLGEDGMETVAFAVDLTERKHAEDESRRAVQRFQRLFQSDVVGLMLSDASGTIVEANDALLRLVGHTRAEMDAGRLRWPEITPPEYLAESWSHIEEVRRTGVAAPWQKEYLHSDGSRVAVMIGSVLLEPGGDQVLSVVMDITERKQAEDALRYVAQASQVLASSLDPDTTLENLARLGVPVLGDWCMIYVTDGGQVHRAAVAHANPADAALAERLESFPAPPLERLGPVLDGLRTGHSQLLNRVPEPLIAALATSPEHAELIHELQATSAITAPIFVRGDLIGIANFFSTSARQYSEADIALADELGRRAGQAVENARLYADAQRANAVKDEFIAMLSHELRNPLAPVLTGVQFMRRRFPDDPQLRRVVDLVERNVKLQARLISDLLDASRIVRGTLDVRRAPMALAPAIEAAAQAQMGDAERAGVHLATELDPGLRVLGDPDRLQQVVMNLLSNAIKFTPAGGDVRVSLSRGVPDRACLVVEDTGIGISPEQMPHLFRMFEQGKVRGERAAGLGIGLAIVEHIVRAHEGRVWAESEGPGKGSRFVVELPLLPEG